MAAGMTSSAFPLRAVVAMLSALALSPSALAADRGETDGDALLSHRNVPSVR